MKLDDYLLLIKKDNFKIAQINSLFEDYKSHLKSEIGNAPKNAAQNDLNNAIDLYIHQILPYFNTTQDLAFALITPKKAIKTFETIKKITPTELNGNIQEEQRIKVIENIRIIDINQIDLHGAYKHITQLNSSNIMALDSKDIKQTLQAYSRKKLNDEHTGALKISYAVKNMWDIQDSLYNMRE
ncbi:MAG: hypothetical protein ACLFN8_03630 [Candidatus Woesearchaeota archaeon]